MYNIVQLRKISVRVVASIVMLLAMLGIINFIQGIRIPRATLLAASENKIDTELPIRLGIPTIHVDAHIQYVGITPLGVMDNPKGPTDVGWLDLGSRPGEVGSAVIAGHSGWKNGMPAVFDNLHKLDIGDTVYVENELGETIAFLVRKTRTYDWDENVPEVFTSDDGVAHLNLITCSGLWNNIRKGHAKRLVVFTDKITE